MSFSSFRFALRLLLPLSLFLSTQAQALQVVTSIKPIQLLVAAISDGVTSPQLLIPGTSSPHDFQLRPSERQHLEQAQLIFWVGPQLEMALTKVLQQLPPSTRIVSLMESLPPSQEDTHSDEHHEDEAGKHNDDEHHEDEAGQHHEDEHHEDEAGQHHDDEHHADEAGQHHDNEHHEDEHEAVQHHDGHNHGAGSDPHIWLDPANAEILAHQIEAALSEVDPSNKARYKQNLQRFIKNLKAVDQQLEQQLSPLKQQGYFVFHDGYQGFEQHYQLNHLGAFTLSPERRPGARHLAEIAQQLQQQQAVCVFSEPQFSPALIDNLIDGTSTRKGELDPMAVDVTADAQGYFNLLRQLGQSFSDCLSQPTAG